MKNCPPFRKPQYYIAIKRCVHNRTPQILPWVKWILYTQEKSIFLNSILVSPLHIRLPITWLLLFRLVGENVKILGTTRPGHVTISIVFTVPDDEVPTKQQQKRHFKLQMVQYILLELRTPYWNCVHVSEIKCGFWERITKECKTHMRFRGAVCEPL